MDEFREIGALQKAIEIKLTSSYAKLTEAIRGLKSTSRRATDANSIVYSRNVKEGLRVADEALAEFNQTFRCVSVAAWPMPSTT